MWGKKGRKEVGGGGEWAGGEEKKEEEEMGEGEKGTEGGEKDHLHPSIHQEEEEEARLVLLLLLSSFVESQSMYLQAVRFSVSGRKCPSSPE
jgi:hypothetical protein